MFAFVPKLAQSQTFNLPDANFKQFLISNYPSLFDENQALIIDSAKILNGKLDCSNKAINDLSGIEYFMSIDTLDCSKNNLSSFPDISKIKSFQYIDISENKFTSLSYFYNQFSLMYFDCSKNNLTNADEIGKFKKLEYLNCFGNKLTSAPSLDSLLQLEFLWLSGNNISELPHLNHLSKLEVLNFQDNKITVMPKIDSLFALRILDCSNNNLGVIPDLSTLKNLEELYCYRASLSKIPDISNLVKLKLLIINNNSLKSLPDLTKNIKIEKIHSHYNELDTILPISHLVNLKSLRVSHNNLNFLPDLSSNKKLQTLQAAYNKFKTIPDLSVLPDLNNVELFYNQLSFEDIIPSMKSAFFADFEFQPQDSLASFQKKSFTKGTKDTLSVDFDLNVANNTYTWFHNNVYVTTTVVPSLVLENVKELDNGVYTCTVTNSDTLLKNIKLNARIALLNVTPCITFPNINYQITSNDCSKGANVEIDDSQIVAPFGPLKFVLTSAGNKSIETNNKKIDGLVPGKYSLTISDTNNCTVSLQNYIYIPNSTSCVASFTPNGDGVEDMFFIEQPGVAKIYDKNGVLVRTLNTPQAWDGCSDGGAQLDMGYYVIVINAKDKIGVVLVD